MSRVPRVLPRGPVPTQPLAPCICRVHLHQAESKLEYPLHICAHSGWAATERQRVDVAATLINAGASLETLDVDGVTPLRAAVACREVKVTRALLDAGADPAPLDSAPWTRAPEFRARLLLSSFRLFR